MTSKKKKKQLKKEQEISPQAKSTENQDVELEQETTESEILTEPSQEVQETTEEEDMETLKNKLAEAEAKSAEYLDGWQRARAELVNYRKRVERDREVAYQNIAGEIILKILPVVDDLELALKNRPQEGEGAAWADGIELIYRKMQTVLEGYGVKPMQAEGEHFDPNLHEAVAQTPSEDHESGQIIEVLQQGYMIGERVLRPALVRVAA